MIIKYKIWRISRKAKKYWKNSYREGTKYDLQFRNDFLVKKIESLMKSLNITIKVQGYDNLGSLGPCFLYANHQDNFDALAIIYALKAQTEAKDDFNKISTFIAKHTLQYKSYTRYPLNCLDTFYLDRSNIRKNLETFEQFGRFVKQNKTYGVIFPEGTRNREGKIGEFKPGSFKIAKKEYIPIIPVTINNSVGGFDLNRKEKLEIEVVFHKKIPASSFISQTTVGLSERVFNVVSSAFVSPKYKFKENKSENDIEQSKSAIKWHKKQNKKIQKEAKKEKKTREAELKIIEQQRKQELKYEKSIEKKQSKNKNK